MTVKDLIEKLREYPQDIPVAIDYELKINEEDIRIIEEFPVGDPANPKCKYLDKVLMLGW